MWLPNHELWDRYLSDTRRKVIDVRGSGGSVCNRKCETLFGRLQGVGVTIRIRSRDGERILPNRASGGCAREDTGARERDARWQSAIVREAWGGVAEWSRSGRNWVIQP